MEEREDNVVEMPVSLRTVSDLALIMGLASLDRDEVAAAYEEIMRRDTERRAAEEIAGLQKEPQGLLERLWDSLKSKD